LGLTLSAWLLFRFGKSIRLNLKLNVFIAAFLGDFITYCITSVQLALAYPSEAGGIAASLLKFLAIFAPTQLPLAVVEGILTVLIIIGMESFARQELKSISFMEN
jgi:cobalt/nickel transport system permease protein